MCVTNIYVDVYPDGMSRTFSQVSLCQYGVPTGRPCSKASTIKEPIRKIQWDEPTTEFMLTQHQRDQRVFPTLPLTPPRSSAGSSHRLSAGYVSSTSDEGLRRRDSKRRSASSRHSASSRTEPKREHRKERIIIVEAPPTQAPRTPPRAFKQTFTAPNSPISRGRPIIVDERPRPTRVPSVGAVVGDRPRRSTSSTRPRYGWDSPSSSHTSFDLAAEERAKAEAKLQRDERIAELEADRRRADRIRAHDEAIKRRPAVPLAPAPLKNRAYLSPVVDQTKDVQGMMGGLRLDERVSAGDRLLSSESRRRNEEREIAAKLRREAEEAEAMKSRLRERQMPGRRFSVGPAQRRERVLYSDGVYRYE